MVNSIKSYLEKISNPVYSTLKQNQVLKKDIKKEKQLRKELEDKIKQLEVKAYTDTLTGISNRESMLTVLKKAISDAHLKNISFGVILVDIDHFKSINDSFSHGIGDIVLKTVAEVVNNSIRNSKKINKLSRTPDELYQTLKTGSESQVGGRYGGEEFLIIVYDIKKDELTNLMNIAERLRLKIDTINDFPLVKNKNPREILGRSIYEHLKYNFNISGLDSSINSLNINRLYTLLEKKEYKKAFTGDNNGYGGLELSISGGLAVWKKGDTPEDLIERADRALFKSKQNGRNQMTAAS